MQGEMEQKKGDERKLPWGAEEMREPDCQEVKKPADRDHDEGMDGKGVGIACEKSREGGEEMENICSVYLLRSRMHDHNPAAVPQAFSAPPPPLYLSVFLPLRVSSFISLCVFFRLSLSSHCLITITIWLAWHCLNPSGLGSGCISMLYITAICCIQ